MDFSQSAGSGCLPPICFGVWSTHGNSLSSSTLVRTHAVSTYLLRQKQICRGAQEGETEPESHRKAEITFTFVATGSHVKLTDQLKSFGYLTSDIKTWSENTLKLLKQMTIIRIHKPNILK